MTFLASPRPAPRADFDVRQCLNILYVLTALNAFNHLDRQLMSILLQPIEQEFRLTDGQLGLLSGPVFAVVNSLLGFPLAVWATHRNRINVVAAAAIVWGLATTSMGFARGFGQLLLGRLGVGVGEAGLVPAAQALISDLHEPGQRTTAMSIFAAGLNLGVFIAFLTGGVVGQVYGWRCAFVSAGVATLLLGLLLRIIVREPPRVVTASARLGHDTGVEIGRAIREVWADPVLRNVGIGATLTSIVGYGAVAWLPSFLIRAHGLNLAETGLYLALVIGIGGAAGTLIGGVVSDRLRTRDIRWSLWFVALAFLATKPFSIAFYLVGSTPAALALLILPGMAGSIFLGPSIATMHDRLAPSLRPLASAILMFLVNLIGLGLGPLLVGLMSERVFAGAGSRSLGYALLTTQSLGLCGVLFYYLAGVHLNSSGPR